jgi:outer membrane protein assembly factor BamB
LGYIIEAYVVQRTKGNHFIYNIIKIWRRYKIMFGIMKRFLLFTLFAIAVNLVFLPCVYAYSAWPMFGHDARHTGRSPYVGPDTPVLKWVSDPIGIFRSSSPVIGPDGTIYIGSDNEYLYAISPNDGSVKWGFLTHGDIVSTPAIGYDGTIHVVSEDGYLYAIQSDGILRWKYLIHGNITSPTIGMDGTIYVAGYEGTLYAIEPTGTLKWKYNNLGGIPTGAPAIGVDGTVYVTTDPGLQAIAPDGTLKWIYDEDSPNWDYSSPAIGSDGTIYYMGTHELYAITPDGKLKWKTDNLGPYGLSSPAIGADGTVYVAVCSGVFAINGYNGSTIWHYPTHTHFAPAIDSGGDNLCRRKNCSNLNWKCQMDI